MRRARAGAAALAVATSLCAAQAARAPIVVAATDAFYADVARQVGGDLVAVSVGAKTSGKDALRFGRGGLDPWLDFDRMRADAAALSARLAEKRPDSKLALGLRMQAFDDGLKPVRAELARLADDYAGEYIVAADVHARAFALGLGAPYKAELVDWKAFAGAPPAGPAPAALQAVASDLAGGGANLFFYDSDAAPPAIEAFAKKVADAGATVVVLRHSLPAKLHWQGFLLRELRTTRGAFNEAAQ